VLFAYLGSSNYIEIALNRANAAEHLNAIVGQSISLRY
jgi:S-adenosylmethionine hydrolase